MAQLGAGGDSALCMPSSDGQDFTAAAIRRADANQPSMPAPYRRSHLASPELLDGPQ